MYVYCTNSWVIGKNWSIRHSYIVSAVANIATKDLADINIDLCLRKLSGFNPNGSAEVDNTMDVNGVTCIKGEIHSLMTLMRLNTRWAAPARFSRELLIQDESPLIQSFRRLNEYLEDTYDLRDVDCVVYLDPFLQVVISEHASGPLTSAALSSLNKFALYGFLSCDLPRASEGINLTAQCISSCVFEETDWESDEIILVKLLELSSTCLRCEASSMLSVGAAWDIFSTCLSIHGQYRASKLLRSEAETALRHLTLTAFSKAESVSRGQPATGTADSAALPKVSPDEDDADASEPASVGSNILLASISTADGLTFFLRKIMVVLSEIMDPQTQQPEQVKFALSLVNIALEAGGPSLGLFHPLVDILRGDVCRHLLRTSQSEDMAIFSLALRVVFNLFVSIKNHMKVQLEVFLTSVHLRLLNSSSFANASSSSSLASSVTSSGSALLADPNSALISLAKEELALESLLEFCREPSLMHDLYTNYDCDVQCTNLFDSIITTLCARAHPSGAQAFFHAGSQAGQLKSGVPNGVRYVNILNRLSFEGVLLVLHAVAVRCWSNVSSIPKKRSGHNLAKQATPHKGHPESSNAIKLSSSLNYLDDEFDVHPQSPGSMNSDFSSNPTALHTDTFNRPYIDRAVSVSSADHSYYNDDGFTSDPDNEDEDENDFLLMARLKTAEVLRQRKIKKQKIRLVAEKFNEKPLNGAWVRFASDLGLLPKISSSVVEGKGGANLVDAKILAKFLKTTAGLDKACVGEYLSKGPKDMYPYHAEVLKDYVSTFDFCYKGKAKSGTFVKALRTFLGQFRLPGEAQCIDRLMEAFATRLFEQLGPNNPFVSADAAFILSFSTIMLNTDQHNPGIPDKKRMKKEEFIRNNRGINGNADLPLEYLEALYDEIKERQIQVDHGIAEQAGQNAVDIISDTLHWDKLIRRAAADQTPASFTPTIAARRYKRSSRPGDDRGSLVGLGSHSFRINEGQYLDDAIKGIRDETSEDSTHLSSISDILPSSIHDADMFHVMAISVLDTLHVLWGTTEDPQVLCKIVEGIWDYASICAVLNFPDYFNNLVRILAEKACSLIDMGSEDLLYVILGDKPLNGIENHTLSPEKIPTLQSNMKRLIKADFDSILLSRKKNAHYLMYQLVNKHRRQHLDRSMSAEKSLEHDQICGTIGSGFDDSMSWEGSQHLKGQLLLRTLFHICNKYVSFIRPAGWTSIVRVLLWCRRRGDLPENLVEIDDFSDARGGSLEPSVYAVRCYNGGLDSKQSSKQRSALNSGGGIWSSVTSLLWTAEKDDASSYDGNSSTRVDIVGGRQSERRNLDCTAVHHHPLLRETMTASRVDALLFLRIRDLSEDVLISIVSCIIDELDGIYTEREPNYNASSNGTMDEQIGKLVVSNDIHKEEATVSELPRDISELDGVMIIEWVSRLMFANMHRTKAIWTRLHDFFKTLLEKHVEEATKNCPYLLERCVVAIVRAAIHLLHFSAPLAISSASNDMLPLKVVADDINCHDSGEDVELVAAVWESLRLLKCIPNNVVGHLSDRLGAGLLTFMRGSPECSSIRTLEQWYLIFSLLSTVSAGQGGRPFVWEAVGYLIDNNFITNLNFSPCRHLVLRFLYRVFPGELDEEARLHTGLPQLSERNPWLTGSLVHLLRLALMACGGYEMENDLHTSSGGSIACRTFPFEDNEEVSLLSISHNYPASSMGAGTSQTKSGSILGKLNGGSVIKVVCIRFSHPEEVQLLLVETVKTFSDFVSVMPLAVSKHASFCLQVLLSSCKRISLESIVWASMLKEMINRLPLNYMKVMEVYGEDLGASEIDTLCLKSCNIVFEAITLNFRVLRGLDEFQNLWLSFLSLLALNINGLLELRLSSKLKLLSEFVEMLVALLRFLVPDTTSGSGGTFIIRQVSGVFDGISGIVSKKPNESARDDILLLHLTWKSILGVCPGMPYCLKKNHSYMLDILDRAPDAYVYVDEEKKKVDGVTTPSKGDEKMKASPLPVLSVPISQVIFKSVPAEMLILEPAVSRSLNELTAVTTTTSAITSTTFTKAVTATIASAITASGETDCDNAEDVAKNRQTRNLSQETISPSAAQLPLPSPSPQNGDYSRMRKIDARTHIV